MARKDSAQAPPPEIKSRQEEEASASRQISALVLKAVGKPPHFDSVAVKSVGPGRYRVNVLVKHNGLDTFAQTVIVGSYYVVFDGHKIVRSDPPLDATPTRSGS